MQAGHPLSTACLLPIADRDAKASFLPSFRAASFPLFTCGPSLFSGKKPPTHETAPLRSRSSCNVASGRAYRTASVQAALPARTPTSHPDEPRLLSSDKPVAPRCSPTCNETAGCFTKCASRCHNAFNVDGYTAYQRTERFPSFLRRSAFSLKAVNRRQRTGAVYPLLNGPGRFPFLPGPLLFSSLPAPRPQAPQAT